MELKAAAASFVAAGDYTRAIAKFTKIPAYVSGLRLSASSPASAIVAMSGGRAPGPAVDAEQQRAIDALLLSTNANLALCYGKLHQHEKAAHFATRALEADPQHVKALFRRAVARRHLGAVDEAREDIDKALQLAPQDAAIKAELTAIKHAEHGQEDDMRKRFAGMFSR